MLKTNAVCTWEKMAALGYYWNPEAALVAVGSRNCYSSAFSFPSASLKTSPHSYCCDDGKKITLKTLMFCTAWQKYAKFIHQNISCSQLLPSVKSKPKIDVTNSTRLAIGGSYTIHIWEEPIYIFCTHFKEKYHTTAGSSIKKRAGWGEGVSATHGRCPSWKW